jgi:gluconate 2-dehydrogenase gamma chain
MRRAERGLSRRGFLGSTLALAGTLPLVAAEPVAAAAAPAATAPLGPSGSRYLALSDAEAAFTEAMVNALCPADHLTPDGVTSGLAGAIDAHLASGADGVPGQRALFTAGIAAAERACAARTGVPLSGLDEADARRFLQDVAAGDLVADFPVTSWWADVVDPLLKQACFSGPVYDEYGSRMFWKMFG